MIKRSKKANLKNQDQKNKIKRTRSKEQDQKEHD